VHLWIHLPRKTYVAEKEGQILETYYIKTNQAGPGSHVCNCGYLVASKAKSRELATSTCEQHLRVESYSKCWHIFPIRFIDPTGEG
jgi:hypothetical protein